MTKQANTTQPAEADARPITDPGQVMTAKQEQQANAQSRAAAMGAEQDRALIDDQKPEAPTVHRVVAVRRGFYDNQLREPGQEFDLVLPVGADLPSWVAEPGSAAHRKSRQPIDPDTKPKAARDAQRAKERGLQG